MEREIRVGDVVVLNSDTCKICKMTVVQIGANFCYCLKAAPFGVTEVVDNESELLPFPLETLTII